MSSHDSRRFSNTFFLILSRLTWLFRALGITAMAKTLKKTYVVVGRAEGRGGSVFRKLRLPGGETTWVMNERVYRKSLDEADHKLREVTAKRKPAAA